MKILVTGALGNIGREISLFLSDYFELRICHWKKPEEKIKYELITADITKDKEVEKAVQGVDAIVHLAAKGAKTPASACPEETFKVNILGTFNLLRAAVKNNIKKFIFASSIWVYGLPPEGITPEYLPIDEEHPLKAKGVYGISKILAEDLCKRYSCINDISAMSLRIGQVVSKRTCSFEDLARLRDKKLEEEARDGLWNHVDIRDLGQIIKLSLESDISGYEVFNVNAEKHISTIDSQKLIKKFFPGVKKIYNKNDFVTGGNKSFYDISKARRLLGYNPKYSLENYLKWVKEGNDKDEYY